MEPEGCIVDEAAFDVKEGLVGAQEPEQGHPRQSVQQQPTKNNQPVTRYWQSHKHQVASQAPAVDLH